METKTNSSIKLLPSPSDNNVTTSSLVSLKTSGAVLGGALCMAFLFSVTTGNGFTGMDASIINESLHGSPEMFFPVTVNYLRPFLIFTASLFISVFILYVLSKIEGQRYEDFHIDAKTFSNKNFPSIFVVEATTMLYVILVIVTTIIYITKLRYIGIEKADDSIIIMSCAAFSILGGALSHLYYFLNKGRPEDSKREKDIVTRSYEFDINRVLRYLSFPFMSAGMGIIAFVLVKGSGGALGIDAFQSPSYWILMLLALIAGYFSSLFIEMSRIIVNKIKIRIVNSSDKRVEFTNKKISATI